MTDHLIGEYELHLSWSGLDVLGWNYRFENVTGHTEAYFNNDIIQVTKT
jgi:hypothetical protein